MSAMAPTQPAARWWQALDNGKVECRLCPRECHIPVGSRGFCFVRANVDGHLELTTYGRSSGFCIDPVEKKPLNHFLPGTPILSFGTAGCNLGCKFCQNWDISKSREVDTLAHTATPEAIVEAALRTKCRSLAFTYNDPIIWAEYAIDICKVAHAHGLKTVAVTAGYISREARREFYEHMDAANVDLKAFTDGFYNRLCQVKLDPVLDGLKYLKHETNVWFEITNLMIPGENDSPDETKAMCGWIVENLGPDVPVHFTAFHPDFKMRDKPPTPAATLVRARQIAMAAGIRYAFVGNVNDVENQSTYCHACGKRLIERDWYDLGAYHLRGNVCEYCGAIIPGVFDPAGPGTWGRKRLPITIGDEPSRLIRITTPMKKNEPEATPSAPGGASPPAAAAPATAAPAATPQIDFTAEQDRQILAYARAILESTLRNQLFSSARLPEPLAAAPTYGLFVSLFRAQQLRSCKGNWGNGPSGALTPLAQILPSVTRDAASNDPRFPRITLAELPYLTVEVSLMHSPQTITARGTDRVGSVQVGTHGLVILHPNGAGLLLPHVAVEAKWDSRTFLEHVCRKAGLPPETWLEDRARLMTFCARKITDPPPIAELDLTEVGANGMSYLMQYIHQVLAGQNDPPGVPSQEQAPALHRVHPEELGLGLQTASGVTGAALAHGQSLLQLAKASAQSLAASLAQRGLNEPVQRMTVLWQPLTLVTADFPARHQTLANSAILAQADGRWSLVVPRPDERKDTLGEALAAVQITRQQWLEDRTGRIRVMAFNTLHCHNPAGGRPAAAVNAGVGVRPAFWPGQFYPAVVAQAVAEVDGFLRAGGLGQVAAQSYRAIMLPHAGWRFCGGTMGKTLAGVRIPKTVIVIGPKHTPLGPACSVANHAAWQIPGATIPVVTAIVQRLCSAVPGLQCEAEAHRQEHGTEVLLPFLLRLQPELRVVPIVLGQCSAETIAGLARELAAILAEAVARGAGGEERPLLVISSDMNHFAAEAENRRRDMLALQAMQTGDPRRLYETCVDNDISMCGLLPAATIMQALRYETPSIQPRLVDYSNSAAASGDFSRVVGYAGVVIA